MNNFLVYIAIYAYHFQVKCKIFMWTNMRNEAFWKQNYQNIDTTVPTSLKATVLYLFMNHGT